MPNPPSSSPPDPSASDALPMLHIHSPSSWHAPAAIVGNRAGLLRLKAALDSALDTGAAEVVTIVADGEGARTHVRLVDHNFGSAAWDLERLPYVDKLARDTRNWTETTPLFPVGRAGVGEEGLIDQPTAGSFVPPNIEE